MRAGLANIGPFPPVAFGVGAIATLGDRVRDITVGVEIGRRPKALIVTDQALGGSPLVQRVRALVESADVDVAVFDQLQPNPTTTQLRAGATAARAIGTHVIIGVGGGSALDAAKGVALAASNPGPGCDLAWGSLGLNPATPIIAVPTTAGTGSETNDYAVITDTGSHRKTYVGDRSCLPSAVILDPMLSVSLPPRPTAATGVDCLTHAIESFTSIRANPWADALDLQVMGLVLRWLPRAVRDGEDVQARSALLLAAHMAGQAMSTTGLGIVHALGHPLGGRHDLPHGEALALVLIECLKFNQPVRRDRFARMAEPLGVASHATTEERNAGAAVDAVENLLAELEMGTRLTDRGIAASDLPGIAEDALADAVLLNTPRHPTELELLTILRQVL